MSGPPGLDARINDLARRDRGRLLAGLIRHLGDFQLAEECLQEALVSAVTHWGRSGFPDNPQGWLMRVAKRKAIDRLRRDASFQRRVAEIAVLAQEDAAWEDAPDIADERLRLIFTCCHPALEAKSRVALTLRLIGGLTTEEIARAFLDKTPAMAARLTRAKAKIKAAGIPYKVPEGPDMAARLAAVLDVIYLIYNEGYAATSGQGQMRNDLSEEALYLARLVVNLAPDQAEAAGLLALIMLSHARRMARQGADGAYVPLDLQDRSLWDQDLCREGIALIETTLAQGQVGPFQVQAAIAALHAQAPRPEATDWPQIVALYQLLTRMIPGPVVSLNLAVARAMAEGVELGLAELEALGEPLEDYQPFHAARADLLRRSGQMGAARAAYDRAIALSRIESERAFLRSRRDGIRGT
ncbi:MAG TPA: RNA polymerase sigma factor [Aliiroseovarius sp.]|nr:RNA polymerase sigma factor [Aliiroseovarius sp.]